MVHLTLFFRVNRVASVKVGWFYDNHVTQLTKNHLLGPVDVDMTHVIFYNSTTMRIASSNLNVSAIIPRKTMPEYAKELKNAPPGAILILKCRLILVIRMKVYKVRRHIINKDFFIILYILINDETF